ncbi:ABC transporter ATP-binding protein [Clostridium cochlearium]|uniref:Iron complex transport system ATP-binding protein n=1 Tax=Clostridium cochlearium TaxID=1494 RepID=A0A240A1D4_CLOCO|nr:ABC transporter ATP-binding protein [Clostridium cochlearium]MBU5269450.1 ABC transporter ATP-binding protein [Clostridium cochlearium]SDL20712.1 iron complex transport system ATP-binding protein [Clostridium cochlearium]SNV76950.1 phosphonate-transporting ATPase [Clostridium cochlearium]SQB33247.1 phosphonate-transporting ATPase [Clostridium cochlearium]
MILQVKNGYFSYENNVPILKNINFSLHKGEVMTILGPNGVGKTTLLKCITGIFKWEKGFTLIDGNLIDVSKGVKEIGYVPQAHKIDFEYTVEEMILMGRARYVGIFSTPSKQDKIITKSVMKDLGIYDLKDRKCSKLSGGQLQLVFVARALVSEPKILVLDEPESHLDFKNQLIILDIIKKLTKTQNLACIFNTHYPEHALKISDKTMIISSKKYIFGDTDNIITEKNIKNFFDVNAKIISFNDKEANFKAIIPLSLI